MKESHEYDVIVVGAGPGGSVCAAYLARKGYKTLLIDKQKFPRDKTCGDAISGSLKVQEQLKLTEKVVKGPHSEVHSVIFSSPKGIPLEIPFSGTGYVCRRFVYDNLVFEKAKSEGAHILENFSVHDLVFDGSRVVGVKGKDTKTGEEKELKAKVVVGADGAHSIVAKKTNLLDLDSDHTITSIRCYYKGVKDVKPAIELHFVNEIIPGYFWIFPLEPGYANVGIGMVNTDYNKAGFNMKDKMFEIIEKNPLFKERFAGSVLEEGSIKGWTLPVGSKRRKAHGNGFVLIGDAAGLIDPFTGEGIANAMTSGQIASEWVDKAIKENNFSESFFKGYEDEVWSVLGPKLATSYKLQKMGKRKFLTNLVISKAAKSKQIQQTLASMLDNKEQRKKLANPLFYLKLLFA